MERSATATDTLAVAQNRLAVSSNRATRNTFLQNQARFTERRLLFYSTMGFLALGAAVVKLGFSYQNTAQQARVALAPILPGRQLDRTMNSLFRLAAYTPFTFKQITQAFRSIYIGFSTIGISAAQTQRTLSNMIDALSAGGFLTEQNVRRISNALQDLAFQGSLTQRMVTRLGQLGVPIRAALVHQLGLTSQQLQNIGKLGIPAQKALAAVNREIETSPQFSHAALRQATMTLYGGWTTLVDFISQASGQATSGVFGKLQKTFQGVVLSLDDINKAGKPVTFTVLARAFDTQLSPSTHLVMNTFIMFEYALKTVVDTFGALFKIVSLILKPLDWVGSLFGSNNTAAKLLGITIGLLTVAFILNKTAIYGWAIMATFGKFSIGALTKAIRILIGSEGLLAATGAFGRLSGAMFKSGSMFEGLAIRMLYLLDILKAKGLIGGIKALAITIWTRLIPALQGLVATGVELAIAYWPITLVVLAITALIVGLTVLYFKWKPFRDIVQSTVKWWKENAYWAKYFLGVFGPLAGIVQGFVYLRNVLRDIKNIITGASQGKGKGGFWSGLVNLAHEGFKRTLGAYTKIPVIGPLADPFNYLPGGRFNKGGTQAGTPSAMRLPTSQGIFGRNTPTAFTPASRGQFNINVVPQAIYLDGQKVGQSVAKVITDREARQ
jgi:hypothetical protein